MNKEDLINLCKERKKVTRTRTEASAPYNTVGGKEVVKMKPAA